MSENWDICSNTRIYFEREICYESRNRHERSTKLSMAKEHTYLRSLCKFEANRMCKSGDMTLNTRKDFCQTFAVFLSPADFLPDLLRAITQNRLLQFSLNFTMTFLNGFQTDWQSLKKFLCLRTEIYVQTQGYILKGKSAITQEIDMIGLQNYVICASLKQIACVKVEIWPQTQGKIFARLLLFFEPLFLNIYLSSQT